ncbi:MAG: phosphate acetyltransferase [Gemmatimonadaceae bacterium]|nr:phosphate acetyltransferase [Gemmatimonadaceae bacterium]NUQ92651.1 phosphate acetyltransferase [Gemmatimonadaceae bacterium]NUR18792.1 phosphate acetyltransferase [Gemmatimonadaceae bacterium]
MQFLQDVRTRAAAKRRRIVFPESADVRTLAAVTALSRDGIVEPVLLLDPSRPESHRAARETGVEVVDITAPAIVERTVARLLERRAAKGLSEDEARRVARDPLFAGAALVAAGEAVGSVAGAERTTADVLRAALWLIGAAPGVRTVSSAFYMVVPPFRGSDEETLTFTDCAVVPVPTAEQLADIAIAAADDRTRIVGDAPRVAMLSFSTRGSGSGPTVELVRAAAALVRSRRGDLVVDGELQGDAALIREVGDRKAPGSGVAGRANVLVFPSLDAGNIAYKLVQRLAHASAVGPIIQGLAKPCSDLSRGAVPDDIINVAAITALQAAG